jgi:transmembrane sensor
MRPAEHRREDEALDWARRIQDPAFQDWDAHLAWLEADSGNAGAFDAACLLIEAATRNLGAALPLPVVAAINDNPAEPEPVSKRGRGWYAGLGLAAAAVVAGAVSIPVMLTGRAEPYTIRTAAGEHREIQLKGGTRIMLNGDSIVRLDRRDERLATVERGEAFFTVAHDAAHPFAVRAGDALFQDVGTAFDVIREESRTQVAVREGAVVYDPKGAAVRLDGGQALAIGGGGTVVRQIDSASAGGWRQGRLSYREAALPEIASDLARTIGRPVRLDPALSTRHFSGVIMIDPDRARMFHRVAAVMGIAVRPDGTGWRMLPAGR